MERLGEGCIMKHSGRVHHGAFRGGVHHGALRGGVHHGRDAPQSV